MLVDIGLNLTSDRYDHDRDAILVRGHAAGVSRFIITGTSVEESEAAVALAATHRPYCLATVGVHPHQAASLDSAGLDRLRALLRQPGVVAVGETGLDFNRDFSPRPDQERAFEWQIGLAGECGVPLFLHERDASDRQLAILRGLRNNWSDGVLHCFTGTRDALFAYLDLGLHIGITGWVCDDRRGQELATLVKDIPSDRLLLETDGPWLLPRDLPNKPKDRRNEPAFLPHIAETVARLRGESFAALAEITTANARRLFRFDQADLAQTLPETDPAH
ncbi:MAG TPA: TatD family hydrolase [Moraxellaceae bacterium]|nr:TatD family hydrolase [Moraxellaceae bacterium]